MVFVVYPSQEFQTINVDLFVFGSLQYLVDVFVREGTGSGKESSTVRVR